MLRVNEIFRSIQGESTFAGEPCAFVRLTGCNLRCTWCDTAYAFHDGSSVSVERVVADVRALGCRLVEITGGEPLLQPESIDLMRRLHDLGFRVLVETGGSLPIDAVPEGVTCIIDIKCPGSGESVRNLWSNLDRLRPGDEVKFVIADRVDYAWAVAVVRERNLTDRGTVLFSPVHGRLDPTTLAEWILEDRIDVRLQMQLHKLLWPHATRGV